MGIGTLFKNRGRNEKNAFGAVQEASIRAFRAACHPIEVREIQEKAT